MKSTQEYPADVFTSLKELLGMETLAKNFSLLARKQKVKSVLGGRHASKLRGRGLDFEEVRHYVKGDDIRNIDWKVTARTRETHTRVFSEEKEKPALIIVDQSKSMFFGSKKRTKSVVAAELAALAAFRVLKQGDRVGGVVMTDDGIDIVYPKRDRRNILRLFDKIVSRNHELKDSRSSSFEETIKEAIGKVRNIVTHDFLIVIISDFHRYDPRVIKNIILLSQHNDVILARVSDPLEERFPNQKFVAGDRDTQATFDGAKARMSDRLSAKFSQEFRGLQEKMKKHRIPLFSLNTIDPVDQQIKEIFQGKKS